MIDDRPRAATVTAATDVTVYGMGFWEFGALVEANPDIASELRQVTTAAGTGSVIRVGPDVCT